MDPQSAFLEFLGKLETLRQEKRLTPDAADRALSALQPTGDSVLPSEAQGVSASVLYPAGQTTETARRSDAGKVDGSGGHPPCVSAQPSSI
jgi:hypothetical protein